MFRCSLQFNNDESSKSHLKVCDLILQQSTRGLIALQPTRSELGPCEFPLSTIQLAQKVPLFSPVPRHKQLKSGKPAWRGDGSTPSEPFSLQSLLVALAPEAPHFFFFFFWEALNKIQLLENSCSTILCLPLPHINMNQPQVYICPLPPKHPSSHLPPHPTLLACHRAPGWAPCCHTENSRSLSILRKVMYVFPRYSPNLSHSPLPPLRPQVCFLCLHFRCCPLIGSSVPSF